MPIIKFVPEDFVVDEKTSIVPRNEGSYTIFQLWKRDCSTLEALNMLSKKWHVPLKWLGVAGLKDKRAITTQLFSAKGNVAPCDLGKVRIEILGRSKSPISTGMLEGNSFKIVVRSVEEVPETSGEFVNYYGEQRFGTANEDIGLNMIKGDWKKACELTDDPRVQEWFVSHPNDYVGAMKILPLKLLKLYVHSYQSKVWNECVSALLEKGETMTEFPIPGFGSEGEHIDVLTTRIAHDGITLRSFVIRQIPELSSEGGTRTVMITAENATMKVDNDDQFPGKKKVTLEFYLPKGCYATEFIRQLFGEVQTLK